MNKKELVNEVKSTLNGTVTKKKIELVVDSILSTITKTLASGNSVQFQGFGTFKPVKRAAREGHNPQTGEAIHIPEKVIPRFHPGKHLKESVRGGASNNE